LLTDGESLRACWIWFVHARIAHFLGKPVILAFQGVGPFRSRVGAWLARNVCRCAAAISVRDQGSRTILDSWNLTIPVVNTFDPVFSLLQSATNTIAKDGVSIVPRFNIDRSFPDRAKKFCADHAAEKVRILLLEPSHEGVIGEMLRQELTSFHPSIAEIHDLEELCTQLSTSSALLTARYHGGVAALAMGIPFETVRQMSGDKLSSLVALHDVPCEELLRRIDDGVRSLEEALRRASPTLSR
jgi:polysaccharide pyruvyl transferase WcaK-like protein